MPQEDSFVQILTEIMHGPIGESGFSGPGGSGVVSVHTDEVRTPHRERLHRILALITVAQHVCEDPDMTTMDSDTRWYLSESTLGLARVLIRSLLKQQ